MPAKVEPLAAGSRFDRLVAEYPLRIEGHYFWVCRCDCGDWSVVTASNLRHGKSRSCGCLVGLRHGHSRPGAQTQTHKAWTAMKQRCLNPRDARYPEYGGRGIAVCERWLTFENFLADMGEPPSRKHSLDRKDVNGNYSPENCRWATTKEQALNKRNTRYLIFGGVKMLVEEAAELFGLAPVTIAARVHRGWGDRAALVTPVDGKRGRGMIRRGMPRGRALDPLSDAPVAPPAGLGSQLPG